MTRYTMPARSQGKLYMQRVMAELVEKDTHRWVFVYNMDPDVETLVRKWLYTRLDNAPSPISMAKNDEGDARGLNGVDNVEGGAM